MVVVTPHRLHTENILLRTADANTDLVICDFGLATIRGFKSYDEGPDVRWACGMRPAVAADDWPVACDCAGGVLTNGWRCAVHGA